jgi:hypothetical protein
MDYRESEGPRGARRPLGDRPHGDRAQNRQENNVIRISTNRNTRFWIFLAKIYLKRYGEAEMQAFGDSISSCVRVCENLERFGYAHFSLVNTVTVALVGDPH